MLYTKTFRPPCHHIEGTS